MSNEKADKLANADLELEREGQPRGFFFRFQKFSQTRFFPLGKVDGGIW